MSKTKNKKQHTALASAANKPVLPVTATNLKRKNWLIWVVLGLVFGVYSVAFSNEFLDWDDHLYVTKNTLIQNPTWVNLKLLLRAEVALNYHPLTMFTLWLNAVVFGVQTAKSFIVVNVLLHLVNTYLVYKFGQFLFQNKGYGALAMALLWGLHPLHVESVAWVAERKDVLYTLFYLLAILQYCKYKQESSVKYYWLAVVFMVLGGFSKAMVASLPLVMLLLDYWLDQELPSVQKFLAKWPFFVLSILFGVLAIHIQGGGNLGGFFYKEVTGSVALTTKPSLVENLRFGFYGLSVYVMKFFVPFAQRCFYAYPSKNLIEPLQYWLGTVLGLLGLLACILVHKRQRWLFFSFMFFFASIVMVLQFLSVGAAIVAERYTYIPYIGLCFGVVYVWQESKWARFMPLGVGLVAGVFALLSYWQCRYYKNTGTLFEQAYKYEPQAIMVNQSLVGYYGNNNQIDKVITIAEKAMASGAANYSTVGSLANAYSLRKDFTKALDLYGKAINLAPDGPKKAELYYNRGICNRDAGLFEASAQDIGESIKANSKNTKYIAVKAFSHLQAKQYSQAIADYSVAIANGIAVDTSYNDRAVARFKNGDRAGAIADLKLAVAKNPNYTDAFSNLQKLGGR
jgi:protein O-mannosyl-transferase